MKLHYYPETDSLHIELSQEPGVEIRHRNRHGSCGFDLLHPRHGCRVFSLRRNRAKPESGRLHGQKGHAAYPTATSTWVT